MIDLNGNTTVYGIIGEPVKHSLSPLFQNHFLQHNHSNAVYLPFQVEPAFLEQALNGLHAAHVQGINVTVPHKEQTIPFVDADEDALTIGAVNTLKRNDGGWEATNTDWQGFSAVLQGLNADVSKSPILLFGAGGTSRAVCHALHHQGAREIWICNRSPERAASLISDLKTSYPTLHIEQLEWDEDKVSTHVEQCRVIINTSSIGLNESDVFPFKLTGHGIAIDVVYKPSGQTAFTYAAKVGGYFAVDGLPMLIAQGISSFRFWHQDKLSTSSFDLPDNLLSLQWVEKQLTRQASNLPGWGT